MLHKKQSGKGNSETSLLILLLISCAAALPKILKGSFFPFLVLVAAVSNAHSSSCYTPEMFKKAIESCSTAPHFILITVRNPQTNKDALICTDALALSFALHCEYGIGRNEKGEAQVARIALSNKERIFTFSKLDAVQLVMPEYTPAVLAEVRSIIAKMSNREVCSSRALMPIYARRPDGKVFAYMQAVAHVLLERGILCGRSCEECVLYIDVPDSGKR